MPEIPGDYYAYAGEIPWCTTYPHNDVTELSFVINTGTVTELVDKLVILRNNEPVAAAVEEEFWKSISDQSIGVGVSRIALGEVDLEKVIEAKLEEMGLEARIDSLPIERRVDEHETFAVLIPVRDNNWESYHSAIVPGRHVSTPAKEIAERLDLCGQPQTFDLFEKNGKRASVAFCYGEPWHTYQKLTYLRKDLLERYLEETGSELIWAIWGERKFHSDEMGKSYAFAAAHRSYKVFQDIQVYKDVKKR